MAAQNAKLLTEVIDGLTAEIAELKKPSKEEQEKIEYGLEERYGVDRSMWP